MTGIGWFAALIVGAIAGWIAEKIMKARHGLLTNIVLGILGAVVGNWLLYALIDRTLHGWQGQLVVGAGGACLLIWLWRAIRR
ncbi:MULTISPECIES: GlsB/YeaQ/YmgE family stress response membrane protein [unclassified Roseivivax]|uniref:GlsB/YeaQ/YmgE family stress response membrane protein n=1 Tax=Roseivivax sp. GX 12232 TaxID=2900547 RepID=UPI001E5915AB|nr:GlsB/YeaQ/YmgE family stress response membrane protein [Roseivivax sp. GX 12232]MCE0506085.1 GlsB/YeaQ/YmgE family stress response membrane protein [Roseivivax sp. GX 12232]